MLYGRNAAGRLEIGELFGFKGMRGVVGCDGIDKSVVEGSPECQPVIVGFDGWVAFDQVSEPLVVPVVKPKVIGRDLCGDMLLWKVLIGKQVQFCGRSEVGNVQLCMVPFCRYIKNSNITT